MEIIDAHVHLFQSRDAGQKAMRNFSPTGCWGTREELEETLSRAGVGRAAAVATLPLKFMYEAALSRAEAQGPVGDDARDEIMERMRQRLRRYNAWLCEQCGGDGSLWAFVHADPFVGMDFLLQEVESRIGPGGARGLKLHPMLGHYYPDAPELWPLYELAQSRGLPLIFHGGRSPESPEIQYAHPERFRKIAREFPKLRVVVAHLGQNFWEATVALANAFENVAFDTSAVLSGIAGAPALGDEEALDLIRKIGTQKVLFASDFPWGDPAKDLERVKGLGFSDSELEAIVGQNARRILGGRD